MDTSQFPSEKWWNDFATAADNFLEQLQKHDSACQKVILDNRRFARCKSRYKHYRNLLRKAVFFPEHKDENNRIDYHKIISGIICSFLSIKPFQQTAGFREKVSVVSKLPNEYFCIYIIDAVLRAWNDDNGILKMDKHSQRSFIALLHLYSKENIGITELPSLSHIVFYIEKLFH